MEFAAVHVGVDLGQRHDPTAVVVVQVLTGVATPPSGSPRTHYRTQSLERLPLGSSYPDVAAYIVKVCAALYTMERERTKDQFEAPLGSQRPRPLPMADRRLFVDATGVGRPVVDILERALAADVRTAGVHLKPITFTHGDTYDAQAGRMGKAYLVSRLQALMQERCLGLPPMHREAEAMARELKDYEIRIDTNANDTYGAFKVGTHDDLVTALGLAVLEDPGATGARIRFFD